MVQELGEEADIDLAKVISVSGLEALDKATLDDLQKVANETGIDMANIQAISESLGGMDSHQLTDMNAFLEESLQGELLEDINAEIAAISDIEGGMEALMNFNSYEDCVNGGGGAVCGTCHCFVEESAGPLPAVDPQEESMLGLRPDRESNSRLSCQLQVSDAMGNMIVKLPEFQM